MFDTLLRRLTGAKPDAPLLFDDARLAMAALMVRVARADHDYAPAEVGVIDELLAKRYQLSADEVAKLRAQAEDLETEAPDTVRFTRAIKDAVPYEERRAVVESLWRVVLADDRRDHHEDSFLRLVANLLGVGDLDRARARQKAQESD